MDGPRCLRGKPRAQVTLCDPRVARARFDAAGDAPARPGWTPRERRPRWRCPGPSTRMRDGCRTSPHSSARARLRPAAEHLERDTRDLEGVAWLKDLSLRCATGAPLTRSGARLRAEPGGTCHRPVARQRPARRCDRRRSRPCRAPRSRPALGPVRTRTAGRLARLGFRLASAVRGAPRPRVPPFLRARRVPSSAATNRSISAVEPPGLRVTGSANPGGGPRRERQCAAAAPARLRRARRRAATPGRPTTGGAAASSCTESSATIDELLPSDVDLVAVAQEVLGDRLAVDERAVGAAEVLEERIGEDRHDRRVLAAHRRVRQADVVVRRGGRS